MLLLSMLCERQPQTTTVSLLFSTSHPLSSLFQPKVQREHRAARVAASPQQDIPALSIARLIPDLTDG